MPGAGQRGFLYALDVHELQVNQGFTPEDALAGNAQTSGAGSGGARVGVQSGRDVTVRATSWVAIGSTNSSATRSKSAPSPAAPAWPSDAARTRP